MATNSGTIDIPTFDDGHLKLVRNFIDSGGMGVVSLYKWKVGDTRQGILRGQNVAVKKLEKSSNVQSIQDEARILWRVRERCEYILRFYGLMKTTTGGISLVLEYMEHSNISHFFKTIRSRCEGDIPKLWPLKLRIAYQICVGMDYLHEGQERPILHCDLKAFNVLLDGDLNVKICDFGLAKIKRLTTMTKSDGVSKGTQGQTPAGTLSHVAPELLLNVRARHNKKSDVYSFGILLWELLSDNNPYEGVQHDSILIRAVQNNQRPDSKLLPPNSPTILKEIMTESWDQDPNKRPEFSELRRRFPSRGVVDNREVVECVAFAKEAWDAVDVSETQPKGVHGSGRSEDGRFPANFCTPSFFDPPPQRELNQRLSDVRSSEVNISSSSSDGSNTSEVKNSTRVDAGSQEPLLGSRPPTPEMRVKNSNACRVVIGIIIVVAFAATGSFFAGRFAWPNLNKGCCIQCFEQSNPELQSSCSSRTSGRNRVAPPGDKCNFSCSDGYVLNGNITDLICEPGGVWSGPMPYCRKIRQCPALNNPANGGTMHCTRANYENSNCSFTCPENYRLRLPGDSNENGKLSDDFDVTCQADAVLNFDWSGREPYCEKIASCSPPTTDQSVRLDCTAPPDVENGQPNPENFASANEDETTYANGTICRCSCDAHMSLATNETTALCMDNGKWNTTADVQCMKGCPAFKYPPHSTHKCTLDRMYNSRCVFTCDKNFVMVGTGNMVCASAGPVGQWTNQPPRCECPSCKSGASCQNSVLFQDSWAVMNSSSTMNLTKYDGRDIRCASKSKVFLKKNPDNEAHGCQCRDLKTNLNKQCNDNASLSAACYHAYSSIVLMMVYNGTVSLPCDADTMPIPGICK